MATGSGQGIFGGVLTSIRNTIVTYKGTVGDSITLADVSKIARVEPITLVSSDLAGNKDLYNILSGIMNIYAAYYLQAIHILSAELSDVRILKILDKTNPDRDLKTLLTSGYTAYESRAPEPANIRTLSLESCEFTLPMLKSDLSNVAVEDIFNEDDDATLGASIRKLETFEKLGSAVGKVVEVKFNVRNHENTRPDEVCIPVSIKLDTMIMPADVITSIATSNTDEIVLGSRFRDALSGRIEFIKDFILCSDIIKAQKKSMIKDPTNYYSTLLKRVNNSKMYSVLSGNISLAGISSILVISEQVEQEVQKKIGGKLTNQKTRDIVFGNTSAMMIAVIDSEWSRVSIYIRDMDTFSQASFDSFKPPSKSDATQITDMLKAFSVNSAPSF